jgi:RNA polymerase sigma-70 factor (ECF subfamily)
LANVEAIELARKAKKGDRKAFEALCELKSKNILFMAFGILGDYHAAEDVAQETILTMFNCIRQLRSPEAFEAWMIRIVRSKCIKHLKARSNFRDAVDIDDEDSEVDVEENDREFLPEAYAEDKELGRSLYDAIIELPRKKREAILMYYYEQLSYKEIAKITDTSVKTVASNISRARKMIKDILEEQEKKAQGMTSASSALVISRVLSEQASQRVPEAALSVFRARWIGSLQPLKYPIAQIGLIAKNAAIAAICTTVVAGGAVGVTMYFDDTQTIPPVEAQPVVQKSVTPIPSAAIDFADADCACGHLNPGTAVLHLTEFSSADAEPQWTVTSEDTGEVFATGLGYEVSDIFARLKEETRAGRYVLSFNTIDAKGGTVTAHRVFEIQITA